MELTQESVEKLEIENEKLKDELKSMRYNLDDWRNKADTMEARVKELEAELKQTEAQDQVVIDGLREKNAKLIYALARLRWEYAHNMETMIDQLYTERPSSWRIYRKSKNYWFDKCQELKKKLMEGK